MKIWIDADAAPGDVKEIIYRAALRLKQKTIFVANSPVVLPPRNPFLGSVRVEGGPNVADAYIADHAEPGDVAVTADVPLSAALVAKNVFVIDPRGQEHTADNMGGRLASRDLMDELRGAGALTGGPRPYGPKDKQAFAATLDRVLTRALRRRPGSRP